MPEPQIFPLLLRQKRRRVDHVPDFPPVHRGLGQLRHLALVVKLDGLGRWGRGAGLVILVRGPRQEILPDVAPVRGIELLVLEREMDARFEGRLDVVYVGGGQDAEPAELVHEAEEDGDRVGVAALEEGVHVLEEDDALPFCGCGQGELEDVDEGAGAAPEFVSGEDVEGAVEGFGDGFRGEGLAYP